MIIRGGTVVTARGVEKADIAIAGDQIAAVGLNLADDGVEIDASGLHVFPGGIDSHVHFNEPGRTKWEDIAHGSSALAAGGYTTFIDMPLNSLPVTTTVEAFDLKLGAMNRSSKVDFSLWGGLVPGNMNQLEALVERGVMGFKAFMCPSGIDEFPACDKRTLREGMKRIAELGSILLVHAEDPSELREPIGHNALDFVASRPARAELAAITVAVETAGDTGCPVHIVHVSTALGADVIAATQHLGADVSGETCPHYLLYTEADMERLGGIAKCAPPFRTPVDRERLWRMPMVVSDHSPCTLELKQGDDFRQIWGGISGCQSTRHLLLADGRLELQTVGAVTSTNIAKRFGVTNKGDIAAGFDADLWMVDLDWEGVVRSQDLLYRNPFSVHEGQKIRGRTIRTLVRGQEPGAGRFIRPLRGPREITAQPTISWG
ncbi:MAG TPA: allantoinase AllB [Candidatus Eisenbacteria bacterium]|nr:allantoinase AllB [Candidatus Eisenbacteria bacterium]